MQFVTIHASKGLQYPVVYLPLLFNKWTPDEPTPLFHDLAGRRTLDVGGAADSEIAARARQEAAGEELRLTYVALTRAQSQVVTWWAPTRDCLPRRPDPAAVRARAGRERRTHRAGRRSPRASRWWPR